jgi:hypothetical protein
MSHHATRQREFAMRRAVGASPGRLVRQLLAESLTVAFLAGLAGFAVSFLLSVVIMRFGEVPPDFGALLTPDARTFFAAATVGVGAVAFFGLAPALTAMRFDVLTVLKDEGAASTAARGSARLRRGLVVAQIALSLTLLVTAGLFFQSLFRTLRMDPGFDPKGLAIVSFDLNLQGHAPEHRAAFVTRFVELASALPDVTSAATTDILPLGGEMYGGTIVADNAASSSRVALASVSPGYFETLGLPSSVGESSARPTSPRTRRSRSSTKRWRAASGLTRIRWASACAYRVLTGHGARSSAWPAMPGTSF